MLVEFEESLSHPLGRVRAAFCFKINIYIYIYIYIYIFLTLINLLGKTFKVFVALSF